MADADGDVGHFTNVFDLLETLSQLSLDRLYGQGSKGMHTSHPWTCRAVFQSLPALGKQYVLRMLPLDGPLVKATMQEWVEPRYVGVHQRAMAKLDSLRILIEKEGQADRVELNPYFRTSLRAALSNHLGAPWSDPGLKPAAKDSEPPSLLSLESWMCAKWNAVLHFLVGATDAGFDEPPEEVVDFLQGTRLMGRQQGPEGDSFLSITNAGMEFLLKDIHIQVWQFVKYLIGREKDARDEILTFLFQLSYCRVGRGYRVEALTDTQRQLLTRFVSFGLIFRREPSSPLFYPTNVAINLIFGASTQRAEGSSVPQELRLVDPNHLSIIVQTNYQVIAYTFSTLHLEMLRHFTHVTCRLPNVVIARITRDSFKRALTAGISARTIINFLKAHVHPAVRQKKARLIPENVEAQIELWNREQARVRFEESVVFDVTSMDAASFDRVRKYAEDSQVLLWATRGMDHHKDVPPPPAPAGLSKGPSMLSVEASGGRDGQKKLVFVKPEAAENIDRYIQERIYKVKR